MLIANINYPCTHFRLRRDEDCPYVQGRHARRLVAINTENCDREIDAFRDHTFGATRGVNQMWIELDLQDPALEEQVLYEIRERLVERYKPFGQAEWQPCQY